MYKILIILVLALSGCAATDHSRTIVQYNIACNESNVDVDVDSLFEKIGDEMSKADNAIDTKLDIPLVKR